MRKLEKIFSIKNNVEYDNNGIISSKHKVISILGIKIKIKRENITKEIINNLKDITIQLINVNKNYTHQNNCNLINILMCLNLEDKKLYRIQNSSLSIVFTKEILTLDEEFIKSFLSWDPSSDNYKFNSLNETQRLYKKNKDLITSKICCRKYRLLANVIVCTTIPKNEKGEIIIKTIMERKIVLLNMQHL